MTRSGTLRRTRLEHRHEGHSKPNSVPQCAGVTGHHCQGVIYFTNEGRVRGVMLCGLRDGLEKARGYVSSDVRYSQDDFRGAIK